MGNSCRGTVRVAGSPEAPAASTQALRLPAQGGRAPRGHLGEDVHQALALPALLDEALEVKVVGAHLRATRSVCVGRWCCSGGRPSPARCPAPAAPTHQAQVVHEDEVLGQDGRVRLFLHELQLLGLSWGGAASLRCRRRLFAAGRLRPLGHFRTRSRVCYQRALERAEAFALGSASARGAASSQTQTEIRIDRSSERHATTHLAAAFRKG